MPTRTASTLGRTSRLKRFLSMPRYRGASRRRRKRGANAGSEVSVALKESLATAGAPLCGNCNVRSVVAKRKGIRGRENSRTRAEDTAAENARARGQLASAQVE